MDKVKTILIFILLGLSLFLYKCNPNLKREVKERVVTEVITKHYTDTVKVYDTLEKTIYLTNNIPVPYISKDIDDTTKMYNNYNVPYEDSSIRGNVYINTEGILKHLNFSYQLKKPNLIITNTDSILITKTITKEERRNKLFIGSSLYYTNNQVSLSFDALFKTKKDLLIGGGYDPFNKVYDAKILITLNRK